jgi:carboxypeptidase Taq
MYEQGIRMDLEGTPLANGTSSGVHESQSRLWENLVGRSRGFWEYFYPGLQQTFPAQLDGVSLNAFYRAINKVERSLIRTDADEVTYNLHVMIRFDLELDLLEGKLAVRDLPEAWNARYQSDLGILPPADRDGVLQDVHWYAGIVGGSFQGYTLGNILAALFYEAAVNTRPDIPAQIKLGDCSGLHGWLKENIYQHGSKFTANELVERATGGPVRIAPYMSYLKTKYGELYPL